MCISVAQSFCHVTNFLTLDMHLRCFSELYQYASLAMQSSFQGGCSFAKLKCMHTHVIDTHTKYMCTHTTHTHTHTHTHTPPVFSIPKSRSSLDRYSPGLSETSTSTGSTREGLAVWLVFTRMKEVWLIAVRPKKFARAIGFVS